MKPKLLYASPFPPQESGISDYSACLVHALRKWFDITLYLRGDAPPLPKPLCTFPVLRHGVDQVGFDAFDQRMYHIGNNPRGHDYIYETALQRPGVVVLHESVLYCLVVGLYRDRPDFYRRLYQLGGARAVSSLKYLAKEGADLLRYTAPERLPLNQELLRSANRFIVHSAYTERIVRAESGPQVSVSRINHPLIGSGKAPEIDRAAVWSRLDIPGDAIVVASFGFIAPTKLNDVVCRVIRRLQETGHDKLYYVMVGHGDFAAEYVGERIKATGYVGAEEFESYLAYSDIIVNLRYPTMGETSGALLRGLEAGKPCIVSNVGWFSELPANTVLKLEARSRPLLEEQLYEALDIFLEQREPFLRMGREAAAYARREHAPDRIARQVWEFLSGGV